MDRERSKPAWLSAGQVYRHHNPQNAAPFFCDYQNGYSAWLVNTESGWAFWARGTRMYEDGTIEWNYSSGGRFVALPSTDCHASERAGSQ